MLVFTGQATVYLVRERGHLWTARPSNWMMLATVLDVAVVATMAGRGILMAPVHLAYIALLLVAVVAATVLLDLVKVTLLGRLRTQVVTGAAGHGTRSGPAPRGA